jgi:hypothetical protein
MITNQRKYEALLEACSVVSGQIAETTAKTKLLTNKLSSFPDQSDQIDIELAKLENEMRSHLVAIHSIDEAIQND